MSNYNKIKKCVTLMKRPNKDAIYYMTIWINNGASEES